MVGTKKAPSKLAFVLSQGGLTGIWRGFLLSEIYAFLVALFFTSLTIGENVGGRGVESAMGVFFGAMLFGQLIGVLPAVIIGLVAGLLIATAVIGLESSDANTVSKLATGIAIMISVVIDVSSGLPIDLNINVGYAVLIGVPTIIFVLDAARTAKKKLASVEANFPSGNLTAGTVNLLFWAAFVFKAAILAVLYYSQQ